MALDDIEKPGTVLALVAGTVATMVGMLVTAAVLLVNWTEPGCDIPIPGDETACAINVADYRRALPFAVLTVIALLATVAIGWRAARFERFVADASRSVAIQVGIVVAASVGAVLGLVALFLSELV